jgi:hypothetical protein
MRIAFSQLQSAEKSSRALRRSLFAREALDDLTHLAELQPEQPRSIATAAFARALAENGGSSSSEIDLSAETQTYLLHTCRQLDAIAESGSKESAEGAELLACMRMFLLRDSAGGERSARFALRLQPTREGAWDLLALSLISSGKNLDFAESCEDRIAAQPSARGSALLMKAYALEGESTQAEWNGLLAAGLYPNDFDVNLTLAALLLERENYAEVLWRAGDALNKAEKQMAAATRQNRLDFSLLKSIYLGLSDQPEQARSLLDPYTGSEDAPELQEVRSALE